MIERNVDYEAAVPLEHHLSGRFIIACLKVLSKHNLTS